MNDQQTKRELYHLGVLLWLTKKYGINNQLFVSREELEQVEGGRLLTNVEPKKGVMLICVPKDTR